MSQPIPPVPDLDAIRGRRDKAKRWYGGVHYGHQLYADSSADVPALLAEIERLREHVTEVEEYANDAAILKSGQPWEELFRQRDAAIAERDRLREELRVAGALHYAEVQRLREDVIGPLRAERDQLRGQITEANAVIVRAQDALGVDHPVWVILDDYDGSMDSVHALVRERDDARAERAQLRGHILDIDAHATPYGDIPDEPGYVGTYLVTAGALHRALGKVEHSAPSCEAEAERDRYAEVVEAARQWRDAIKPCRLSDCDNTHQYLIREGEDALVAAVDRLTPGDETPGGEP